MTKQEFLNELREALSGEVTPEAMMDSYRYYSSYIDDCVREGKTEEEVIEELGKPSFIARSIIAANNGMRSADEEYTEDGRTRKIKREQNKSYYHKEVYDSEDSSHKKFQFNPFAWYAKILYALVIILLVVLVFSVVTKLVWFFVRFGIPILLVLGIVYLLMYFFGNREL